MEFPKVVTIEVSIPRVENVFSINRCRERTDDLVVESMEIRYQSLVTLSQTN